MTRNTSVSLTDHHAQFVDEQVGNGTYNSPSEVVNAGLRLLEAREAKVRALQSALQEGLDSGPAVPFDGEEFLKRMREKYGVKS